MARDFPADTSASNYGLYATSQTIQDLISGAAAVSIAALVYPVGTIAERRTILRTNNSSDGTNITLRFDADDDITIGGRSTTTDLFRQKSGTTNANTNAWNYVGGVMDFAGDYIQPYIHGLPEGGGAATFDSSTFVPSSSAADNDAVGGRSKAAAPPADSNSIRGYLEYLAIWSSDIGDAGFAALAGGADPCLISPATLVFHPFLSVTGNTYDRISGVTLTEGTEQTHAVVGGPLVSIGPHQQPAFTPRYATLSCSAGATVAENALSGEDAVITLHNAKWVA